MMLKAALLLISLFTCSMFIIGCGGGTSTGVADRPEKPAPVMTPDERNAEAESARAASQSGQ
jgi:hypothetical protein